MATNNFINDADVSLNPEKCKIVVNNPTHEIFPEIMLQDENGDLIQVEYVEIMNTVKYWGVPLSVRKLAKMRYNNRPIGKVRSLVGKIGTSGLKIAEVIHAIKNFITPKFDYIMANSVVGITCLKDFDALVRKIIHNLIQGPYLSKGLYYTSWKEGGLV
ncbi:MAG: hypothetical protein Ta2E_11750 [Mycoplasmoidaceae bacterium]|nr:MAG: hypothetical protein Ta2E_11750 [Mycoplasmoidaceae bacterium]